VSEAYLNSKEKDHAATFYSKDKNQNKANDY